jgi:hypothetical protein
MADAPAFHDRLAIDQVRKFPVLMIFLLTAVSNPWGTVRNEPSLPTISLNCSVLRRFAILSRSTESLLLP